MVDGLKSLNRKLTRTIPRRVRERARQALAVWADTTQASMEAFVPERTGALFESIGWVWGDSAPSGSISVGTLRSGADPDLVITMFAGNDEAFWARWVEFGTQAHSIGSGEHPGTSAQPFFYPAVRLNRKGGRRRLTRAIRLGLQEASR